MIHDIVLALWFMLPVGAANVAPILTAPLPVIKRWNTPIDGGRTYRGRPIFGKHKTWRGLLSGILLATLALWLQQRLIAHQASLQSLTTGVNYAGLPTWLLGPLFGIGALGGDAIESFFKRQHGTPAGEAWFPFDQIDYILGGILVSLPFVVLSWHVYLWIFIIWFGMHIVFSYLGFLVGLKESPI